MDVFYENLPGVLIDISLSHRTNIYLLNRQWMISVMQDRACVEVILPMSWVLDLVPVVKMKKGPPGKNAAQYFPTYQVQQ